MSELLEIRGYREGDEDAILPAFEAAFRGVDPERRPRSPEVWRWLYRQNPAGHRLRLALRREPGAEARVVAQYAGVRQRVLLEGRPAFFSQSVDSFSVDNRGLDAPFVRAGRAYAADFGGPPPDGDSVMWGLPVPSAWRVGRRLLGYGHVRTLDLLVAPPLGDARAASEVVVVSASELPPETDELFARFAAGRGALAVRDRAHLRWRYLERPDRRYRVGLARDGASLRGLAVLGRGRLEGRGGCLLCDWVVPPEDGAAASALRAWARAAAAEQGAAELAASFPDSAPEFAAFQADGFRVVGTDRVVAARCYEPELSLAWLRARWYLTLGDTDLV